MEQRFVETGWIFIRHYKYVVSIATESFSIKRSTGDVTFDGADAKSISVKTDTGDVKGSLLSNKVFITKTDTGDINVPSSTTGGKCEITTDTGDINLTVQK